MIVNGLQPIFYSNCLTVDESKGLDNYLLQTPVNEIYAWRLLKLKRELLLELTDKENFTTRQQRRRSGGQEDIYEKYAEFVVPHEQADWTGLTLRVRKACTRE